ncbi:PEP-CTERM sorting domain-containing protein [Pseudoduganella lutea]|uniref:PEP-CTERM sorting domain-containing protein n=1 Tax=Pseudoduganella lutea TaxID=321985 RepID=A0A4P6KTE0_9BURK|nr:PEP-CTERM sorting domain-containing protein [Pseudoduganella lutea]QBE61662.1 PEP-CTERM sorting domain-containing protein [Pseudoduganella lutea]
MANKNHAKCLVILGIVAAAMGCGVAQAESVSSSQLIAHENAVHELQVNTVGILNNDERGAATNVILDFYVGAGASITSFAWNVNVTSYPGSYLSEMQLTFTDSLGYGVTFTPGSGDDFDGTMDYAGFQDLGELGQVFAVGADGILRLEFHDGFKDLAFDEPEGVWNSGTLTFGIAPVPEAPMVAMMLGGLLLLPGALKRRRR